MRLIFFLALLAASASQKLYDLDADLGERHDLAIGPQARPDVLKAIEANFSAWFDGVLASRKEESRCPQDDE